MIELGLSRIGRLLQKTPQPWRAVHVAGTNGKGSICANITAIMTATGIKCGRYTSPHLVDYWDGIQVPWKGGIKPVPRKIFFMMKRRIMRRNVEARIGATEFEILTATAFEIFNRYNIDLGVIEVGLGGALDATNILAQKSVTVISKIGLDHQGFLGDTIEEIARHKAGIMRPGVPCVVDDTNSAAVLQVLRDHAQEIGTTLVPSSRGRVLRKPEPRADGKDVFRAPHEWHNFTCAYTACKIVQPGLALPNRFFGLVRGSSLRGRLAVINLHDSLGRDNQGREALLDGAHNEQSARALGEFVDNHYAKRQPSGSHEVEATEASVDRPRVTWLIAISKGREARDILKHLIRPNDQLIAVEFGRVPGMPWVSATPSDTIIAAGRDLGLPQDRLLSCGSNMAMALQAAMHLSHGHHLVIAGSLYLVSDTIRYNRAAKKGQLIELLGTQRHP